MPTREPISRKKSGRRKNAARLLGADLASAIVYSLEQPRDRALLVYAKTRETPRAFPEKTTIRAASRFDALIGAIGCASAVFFF